MIYKKDEIKFYLVRIYDPPSWHNGFVEFSYTSVKAWWNTTDRNGQNSSHIASSWIFHKKTETCGVPRPQNTDRFQIKWGSVILPSIAPPFGTSLTETGKNSYIQLLLISTYVAVETLNSALGWDRQTIKYT